MLTRRSVLKALLRLNTQGSVNESTVLTHRQPSPLSPKAITHDWRSFLGPTHNSVSTETFLRRQLPPPLIWELPKGSGYSSPAIAGDRLVFVHRISEEEIVECLNAETGTRNWQFRYPTKYEDRYGYNNGPRSSPVVAYNQVYTVSAEGQLRCLDLDTGGLYWNKDLHAEYGVDQDFFGASSTPLIEDKQLIVNVGGSRDACVVSFDINNGRELWRAGNWGASYASPIPATIHDQRRVMVFAGGESRPPTGGLLSIDPKNGKLDFSIPHRSRTYESVNAACPVIFNDKVFITASYRTGGMLVELDPDFSHRVAWTTPNFALHFNTPIYQNGFLYGFDGRNQGDASLACIDASNGEVRWREVPSWTETNSQGNRTRPIILGTGRGSLLAVDGQFLCLGEFGHLLWMDLSPEGYREVSRCWLFSARESWTLPVLSRGLLYVVQNTRDIITGDAPRLLCYDLRNS